ncbi:dipeptide/oligopeptide/nickel ABC transporter permease/ATP-binding protein [Phytohabitans rumicis]|uniref:Peptide ABC transporter ATP-binding protein n=1 Tax=Phytohabitans rumicis TaxID=1076125 RepID=A0A6V8LJB4_9ACTN|nr:dipeptide/oligopeptide/nickel ABC transporter permease/ATP-binding protein [Phytohabitans rumicis]GFJ96304.1 peptide ABC transporter ATP-binding protein [Phytohabitans rumicis]
MRAPRTPLGLAAALATAALFALVVAGPLVWGDAAARDSVVDRLQPPSAAHPFGTDEVGRDVLARVLTATRLSVLLAVLATLLAVALGLLLGALPSVLGRRSGRFVAAAINVLVAFPGLLLALFFAIVWGAGARGAVLAIGLAGAPVFARLTQTLAASVAGQDYIAAARVVGVGRTRILFRHVLPNIAEPLIVNATIGAGGALLAFAGLSFLGLGIQPPGYDWGRLLNEGLDRIYVNPAAALAPGLAVVLAGLTFNLLGEALAAAVGRRTARVPPASAPQRAAARPAAPSEQTVLRVRGLRVSFPAPDGGWVTPVDGVDFDVRPGEAVGVVGESGSGKSLTAMACAGLIERPGRVEADRLEFLGHDLDRAPRSLLGTCLAVVFQDPMTSLNPALRVGRQLAEVAEVHQGLSRRAALARAVDRLRAVRIADPERRARQHPHELSGGMRQRAMIGAGLMGTPRLIVADEPTTALDVTVQKQVLELLARARADAGAAILFISHDIAVVSGLCDRVLVMYGGTVVEDLTVERLLSGPAHPYTRALLASVPHLDTDRDRPLATIPGRPPDPARRPPGCAFAPRCDRADERCATDRPPLTVHSGQHKVACWNAS